jgi:hypothetical protein
MLFAPAFGGLPHIPADPEPNPLIPNVAVLREGALLYEVHGEPYSKTRLKEDA